MNEFFKKLKFLIKKRGVVIIVGKEKETAKRTIAKVLEEKRAMILESEDKEIKKYEFFLKKAEPAVLIVTNVGDIPFDRDYFVGERNELENTRELIKKLPSRVFLILNYDDETTRELDDVSNLNTFTFGFSEKADFFVSDVKFNHGVNFKVNYRGSVVPFWLEKTFGKRQIYSALVAIAVGIIFDLNLVKISQSLRNYQTLPGKMRMIEGIKGSWILDDTESATVFSMIEAIEILGKIPDFKRKIAVLGDVTEVEKYSTEAHQTIGEKVAKNSDLLFTFGQKARFIGKGAFERGMSYERIFSFDKIEDGIEKLKETIKPGDLILVDGSKEMKMSQIVDQIRKIW